MALQLLDTTKEASKIEYASAVKTGLISGFLACVVYFSIQYAYLKFLYNYSDPKEPGMMALTISLCVLIVIISGMFRIAAWGNRKYHYFRIVLTGIISYQILMGCLVLAFVNTIAQYPGENLGNKLHVFVNLIFVNLFIVFLAFILWLIPGKLPYFRKQIEP